MATCSPAMADRRLAMNRSPISDSHSGRTHRRHGSPELVDGVVAQGVNDHHRVDGDIDRGGEQLLLGAEVVVHQRGVDPGVGGDRANRGLVDPVAREQFSRAGQNAFAGVGGPGGRPGACVGCWSSTAHGVRRRRVAAARPSATTANPTTTAMSRTAVAGQVGMRADLLQRLQRVAGGQHIADPLQPFGQHVAGDDDAAQQQLRHDHHRHELHGLKLGAGERTTQQAQSDAEHGVDDRDDEHPGGLPAVSRPSSQNDTMHASGGLHGRGDREGRPVGGQQVEPPQRSGQNPFRAFPTPVRAAW